MIKYAGIDYSMSCPSVSVGTFDEDGTLNDLKQYFATYKKGEIKDHGVVTPALMSEKNNSNIIVRYKELADWALDCVQGCSFVLIEDYAFGASGRLTAIGENTGILKYNLTVHNIPFGVIGPKVVKSYATKNGNADKNMMYEAYQKATGIDLSIWRGKSKEVKSPVADLSDSYWILQLAATDKIR
jgi:hypothetical protein